MNTSGLIIKIKMNKKIPLYIRIIGSQNLNMGIEGYLSMGNLMLNFSGSIPPKPVCFQPNKRLVVK